MIFPHDLRNRFRDYIANRGGLYFQDHDLKGLESAITGRMKECGIDAPPSYYIHLTTSEHREDELRELLNVLTVNHTYFFRNEPQFSALKERILPEIIDRKRRQAAQSGHAPAIRVWSAGCSSGEEPYSIAILLHALIPDIEIWNIEIMATDASSEALKRARRGEYSKHSIRLVDAQHLERYFEEGKSGNGSFYILDEVIRNMVSFSYLNLIEADYPSNFDIIMCRNVVIYFELNTTVRVMNKFHRALNSDGYLFIGYSETLQFISDRFKMVTVDEAILYRKAESAPAEISIFETPEEEVDRAIERLSRAERLVEWEAEKRQKSVEVKVSKQALDELMVRAIKSVHLKDYASALSAVERVLLLDDTVLEAYYVAAEIYSNQGKVWEARSRLLSAIAIDSMFAPAYCLMGILEIQEENLDEARRLLKKALFLDGDFSVAHYYMAILYRKEGLVDNAIREYRNTLKVLSGKSPGDVIAYSGGFNVGTFSSVCKNNLERLKNPEFED